MLLNTVLHKCIVDILISILGQYRSFAIPNWTVDKIIYIVVDSNPLVGGGYIFFKRQTIRFVEITPPQNMEHFQIVGVSENYIREYNYQKVLH